MSLPHPPLLLITDRSLAKGPLPDIVRAAFAGGCRWVMLRDKDARTDERRAMAATLAGLAREIGATLLVNDDLEAAEAAGAQGVHLAAGRSVADARELLGRGALIGASAHSAEEALAAAGDGADYVTLSPVFETASKPGYGPALGLPALARLVRQIPVPVLALGGVTAGNAAACRAAGAAGIAVMGGIMAAEDPEAAARALVAATMSPAA